MHLHLTESHHPGDLSRPLDDLAVGDALVLASRLWPNDEALVECGVAGTIWRRWTYVSLLAEAKRLALALLTRYAPGERIAVWVSQTSPGMGDPRIQPPALAGPDTGDRQPRLQGEGVEVYVLAQSRSRGLFIAGEYRGATRMDEIARGRSSRTFREIP